MTVFFLNHLWQSTLFAGVIALLAVALRHNRARLRYGLWLVASVKFLVPFATLAAAGGLVEWQQAPAPIRSVVASPGVRDFNAPFAAMWLDPTPKASSASAGATWRRRLWPSPVSAAPTSKPESTRFSPTGSVGA